MSFRCPQDSTTHFTAITLKQIGFQLTLGLNYDRRF